MIKDFNFQLINLDGSTLKEPIVKDGAVVGEENAKPVNILIANALATHRPESNDDPAALLALAVKLYNCEEIDLKSEQITLIKKAVLARYPSVLVSGQINKFLDS